MKTFVIFGVALAACAASAITFGQVDTFEDGTAMGWQVPVTQQPENIPTGGPRGVDDNYLRFAGGLPGHPQKLAMYNLDQWAGDWLAAGVAVVEMHVKNEGPDDVELRAVWHGQSGTRYTSTKSVFVPADNTWYKIAFPCRESDLTEVFGFTETYAEVMGNVERFMLRHDGGTPSAGGEFLPNGAAVGVDNIEASNKADFQPVELTPVRGVRTGGLFELLFSDDQRVQYRPGIVFTTTTPPVEFRVTSFATFTNPTSFSFNLEGHTTAATVRREFALLNHNTGLFEVIAPYANSATSDELITVAANPALYIDPVDGRMEARIAYRAFGPVFAYPWHARQDRIYFRLTP